MLAIENLFRKIKRVWTASFLGAFISGFLAYIYLITNHFGDADILTFQFDEQNMIFSGRQFLTYASKISSFYDLQALNGILALVYIGIVAAIITEVFDIKRVLSASLTGAVLALFPAVSATMSFHFAVDAYMLAVLLVSVSFLLTTKYRFGFIPSIILTGISLGIYQAYFAFLITLCILYLLTELIERTDISKLFGLALKYVCMGAGGFGFYYVTLKLMLKSQNLSLSDYQGADTLNGGSIDLPAGLRAAYHNVGRFLFVKKIITLNRTMVIAFALLILSAVVMFVYMFFRQRKKLAVRGLLVLLLLAILPLGMYIVSVMLPEIYYYNLMEYAWALLLCFVVILADRVSFGEYSRNRLVAGGFSGVTVICTVLMCFQFALAANVTAYNLNELYEKSYGFCLRLVDRLEQTEGFDSNTPVVVLGGSPSSQNYPSTNTARYSYPYYEGIWEDWMLYCPEDYQSFISHFIGVYYLLPDVEKYNDIANNSETYKNMTCFPEEGSIEKIDGIWVVKLG